MTMNSNQAQSTSCAINVSEDLFDIHRQVWLGVTRYLIFNKECSCMLDLFDEPRRGGSTALIWSLWVSPNFRQKGLATRLLNTAENIARHENQKAVDLDWHPKEAEVFALEWYKRRGYKEQYENLEGEKHMRLHLNNNNDD